MKRREQKLSVAACLIVSAMNANAFNDGDLLAFDPGVTECLFPEPYCSMWGLREVVSGSYFALDLNGNAIFEGRERFPIAPGPDGGVVIGQVQPGPGIDMPFDFFGAEGMHQTSSPIVQNADGTLDFSGWEVYWSGMVIPFVDGDAVVNCSGPLPCAVHNLYHIDYTGSIETGPFQGVLYAVHLENGASLPAIEVDINVIGGKRQECMSTGGSNVSISAEVALKNGAQLSGLSWTVDGQAAGAANDIFPFLSLGSHTISVTATGVSGIQASATTTVNVVDTVAPVVTAAFYDRRSGEAITSIDTMNTSYVGARILASDVCDASPAASGLGGFVLSNGDTLKVQGNLDKVELTTSSITMEAKAVDSSGNSDAARAVLTISQ